MKIENTIPDDWNTYSLGEIADIKMGQSPPSSAKNGHSIPPWPD